MSDQPLLSGHLAIGLTVIHSSSSPSLSPLSLRDGGNMRDLGNEFGSDEVPILNPASYISTCIGFIQA